MEKTTIDLKEAITRWNIGENVWSAELGGIGPQYEMAIQTLLWEILSRWDTGELPDQDGDKYPAVYTEFVDKIVHEFNEKCGGFSGAQVGAAKGTAWQFMKYGYAEMMNKLEEDRHILISNDNVKPKETHNETKTI